jgi:hypothetical protein
MKFLYLVKKILIMVSNIYTQKYGKIHLKTKNMLIDILIRAVTDPLFLASVRPRSDHFLIRSDRIYQWIATFMSDLVYIMMI